MVSPAERAVGVAAAWASYAFAFALLEPSLGAGANSLVAFPVIVTGALLGPVAGLLAGPGWLLLAKTAAVGAGERFVFGWPDLLYAAVAAGIGGGVGYLARLRDELRAVAAREEDARRRAERDERRWRALFDGIPAPAWVFDDRTLEIVEVNDAAVRLYGHPRHALLKMKDVDLCRAEDVPGFLREREARDRTRPWVYEARHRKADGTTFPVLVNAADFQENGTTLVLAVAQDLTERTRGEQALRRADRLQSLGTLVAGVAHEINNPLTFALGNVELARLGLQEVATTEQAAARGALAADVDRQLAVALGGLERIARVVRELRQVSRNQVGPRTAVDLESVVRAAATIAAARLAERTEIEYDLRPAPPVLGNEVALSQVVLNLLLNAADAVRDRAEGRIRVERQSTDGRVLLVVRDNGPGIPEEVHERIFTPFFTTKPEGTGLGLSISQSIATALGGSLSFTTSPDGTSFVLDLPAARQALERAA